MRRTLILTVCLCTTGVFGASASAQEYCASGTVSESGFHHDYYRNKMWPLPFRAMLETAKHSRRVYV